MERPETITIEVTDDVWDAIEHLSSPDDYEFSVGVIWCARRDVADAVLAAIRRPIQVGDTVVDSGIRYTVLQIHDDVAVVSRIDERGILRSDTFFVHYMTRAEQTP